MSELASIYYRMGRIKEAVKLGKKVMDIRQRLLGDEHPDTLLAMSNLTMFYSQLGRIREAEELKEKVTEARKKTAQR
jgi:tetratricopeptide (TPR) repeat protein